MHIRKEIASLRAYITSFVMYWFWKVYTEASWWCAFETYIVHNIISSTDKTPKHTTHLQCHINTARVVVTATMAQKMNM